MIFIECDFSVYKRLTGYPVDAQGRPQMDPTTGRPVNREVIGPPGLNPFELIYDQASGTYQPVYPVLPSYGIRIPQMIAPSRGLRGLTSMDPAAVPKILTDRFQPYNFRQVPVFDENIEGREWDKVFPCVTFAWDGLEEAGEVNPYFDDFGAPLNPSPFGTDSLSIQDPTSAPVQIKNSLGTVVAQGFSGNTQRPNPEGWNLTYRITAHAKSNIELQLICAEIMKLFPQKGAINVQWADGRIHACDMFLRSSSDLYSGIDNLLMTQGGEQERGFARSFMYVIEAYFDNTTNQFGIQDSTLARRTTQAAIETILELDAIMQNAVAVQADNVNADNLELFPTPVTGVG